MTDIVTPPPIDALPPPPLPTDTPAQFDAKAFATLSAQAALVGQVNAATAATAQNAVAANERAVATSGHVDAAYQYAVAAQASEGVATTKAGEAVAARNEAVPAAATAVGAAQSAAADAQAVAEALANIADGPVTSVNGKTGVVELSAADVGAATPAAVAAKADKAGPTLTGPIAANGSVRGNKIDLGASNSIDCSLSNYFTKTVNGNTTLDFANVPAAPARYCLFVEVSLVSGVLSWPVSVVPPSGGWPALSAGKVHLFGFFTTDGDTKLRGAVLPNYAS